jgi:hypothetical protein
MELVEVTNEFLGILQVVWRLPSAFLMWVTLPFDQVLKFPPAQARVLDIVHFIFMFHLHNFWGRSGVLLLGFILGGDVWRQEDFVEYRVNGMPGLG